MPSPISAEQLPQSSYFEDTIHWLQEDKTARAVAIVSAVGALALATVAFIPTLSLATVLMVAGASLGSSILTAIIGKIISRAVSLLPPNRGAQQVTIPVEAPVLAEAPVPVAEEVPFETALEQWYEAAPPGEEDARITAVYRMKMANIYQTTDLDLDGLSLSSLPEAIGALKSLKKLHLRGNQLTTLPATIGALYDLRDLNLMSNRITHLPDSIKDLQNLRVLNLSQNDLVNPPAVIEHIRSLRILYLVGNPIISLPAWLVRAVDVQVILANPLKTRRSKSQQSESVRIDALGNNILHIAIETNKSPPHCLALLQSFPDSTKLALLATRNKEGLTPLHYAIELWAPAELFRTLLMTLNSEGRREILNLKNHEGDTILLSAMRDPQPDILLIKTLVELGSNLSTLDHERNNALHLAIQHDQSLVMCRALLEPLPYEEKVALLTSQHVYDVYGGAPLHFAIPFHNAIKLLSLFLSFLNPRDSRELVNIRNDRGETPLHMAHALHLWSLIFFLLEEGANPELRDHQNQMAIEPITLERAERVHKQWNQFQITTDERQRVVECSYFNEEQQNSVLTLQPRYTHNQAFRFHIDNLTAEIEHLTLLSDHFHRTHLQTVDSVEEATHLLRETKSHLLIIQGHGPGEDRSIPSSVKFGSLDSSGTPKLLLGNASWLDAVQKHMENQGTLVFDTCGLARNEEREEDVNLCEEVAAHFEEEQGITVIGSDAGVCAAGTLYQPSRFPMVRFFSGETEESTVVYQLRGESRTKYSGYTEKVLLEDYFAEREVSDDGSDDE